VYSSDMEPLGSVLVKDCCTFKVWLRESWRKLFGYLCVDIFMGFLWATRMRVLQRQS